MNKLTCGLYPFINRLIYGAEDLFSFVSVETTTECNRRCAYCPNSKFDRSLPENKKLLDDKLFYKLVDELSAIGYGGFFSPSLYGEPLLDKRMPLFVRYAKNKLPKAVVRIFTNGDLLTVDNYKLLASSGISVFSITKHSDSDPAGVREVIEYRKRYGDDNVFLSYEKLEDVWNRGGLIGSGTMVDSEHCRMSMPELAINYKGDVILCCNDYLGAVTFGNIGRENVMDIWKKKNFAGLRKNIREEVFELEICRKCREVKNKKA